MNYIFVNIIINLRIVVLFQVGDYVVIIMDYFGVDFFVFFVVVCECVVVMWVYGMIFIFIWFFYNSVISFSLLICSLK